MTERDIQRGKTPSIDPKDAKGQSGWNKPRQALATKDANKNKRT